MTDSFMLKCNAFRKAKEYEINGAFRYIHDGKQRHSTDSFIALS